MKVAYWQAPNPRRSLGISPYLRVIWWLPTRAAVGLWLYHHLCLHLQAFLSGPLPPPFHLRGHPSSSECGPTLTQSPHLHINLCYVKVSYLKIHKIPYVSYLHLCLGLKATQWHTLTLVACIFLLVAAVQLTNRCVFSLWLSGNVWVGLIRFLPFCFWQNLLVKVSEIGVSLMEDFLIIFLSFNFTLYCTSI